MNDPRDTSDDHAALLAAVDQLTAESPLRAQLLVSEWKACVDLGMGKFAAAALIGTRWSANV